MNLNSFLLEQALKKLKLSEDSLEQFRLVSASGDVDGTGFPAELFELSAPMIIRGLLNFSLLQMNRNWLYPYWVHQQLDPHSPAFVARSQNPLLINITHRNWTTLGSPTGLHEAIVDPRGLVTPLPREWSVDTWLVSGGKVFFPSLSAHAEQMFDTNAPNMTTVYNWQGLGFRSEAFVSGIRGGQDVVFCRSKVINRSSDQRRVRLCVAIRPFGVEGVAPIKRIEFKTHRLAFIDGVVGIAFDQDPDVVLFGNAQQGDVSTVIAADARDNQQGGISCPKGLANAAALFDIEVAPQEERAVCYSIALGSHDELKTATIKRSWRVSFEQRRIVQKASWKKELEGSFILEGLDEPLQKLFEASRTALLEFQDEEFISPGPYLYHHFWFRDAAPMLKALDVLGFPRRVRQVIDGFPTRLTPDGFFRAPGGEWDSNGAALWIVYEHFKMNRSLLWLKQLYPALSKAGRWIINMRKKTKNTDSTHEGLMPRSLSAEHLGTVDQYYWDSFWSLAGLRALSAIAREVRREDDTMLFEKEAAGLEQALRSSLEAVTKRLGATLIPATPFRSFDESAIGSICCLYPLNLFEPNLPHPDATLAAIEERFIDDRGFFHPIVHSGYNAYLTLHVAHALLLKGDTRAAWRIASTVFRQTTATYTYPEAIHPKTGGGAMGDGHHGWAAAEVILFLRDSLLSEAGDVVQLFGGILPEMLRRGRDFRLIDARTAFGKLSASLEFLSDTQLVLSLTSTFFPKASPAAIEVFLPWKLRKTSPSSPKHLLGTGETAVGTKLILSPDATSVLVQLEA